MTAAQTPATAAALPKRDLSKTIAAWLVAAAGAAVVNLILLVGLSQLATYTEKKTRSVAAPAAKVTALPPPKKSPKKLKATVPTKTVMKTLPALAAPPPRPHNVVPELALSGSMSLAGLSVGAILPDLAGKIAYRASAVDKPPQVLHAPQPKMPAQARADGISGSVTLRMVIDVDGQVSSVSVLSATPPGVFEKAAIAASRGFRFQPALKNGRPVPVAIRRGFDFDWAER